MMIGPSHPHRFLFLAIAPWLVLSPADGGAQAALPAPADIVSRMKTAYDALPGYRTETEVTEYRDGKVAQQKSFLYTLRKPRDFRIEMHSPHRGTVLLCCDREGQVLVRPGGIAGFLKVRLDLDNPLLRDPSGQRLDQTDFGRLIAGIQESLTSKRRGEPKVSEEGGRLVLEVVSVDQFRPDVLTLYRFQIDRTSWLPAGVSELTPEGELKRVVTFKAVEVVAHFPAGFFDTDGAGKGEGSGGR